MDAIELKHMYVTMGTVLFVTLLSFKRKNYSEYQEYKSWN